MNAIQIQLPQSLRSYLEEQVAKGGYKDASDFLRSLIEAERHRQIKHEIVGMLEEVVDGPFADWTDQDVEDIRQAGTRLIERRQGK